jgi:acetolactate synthase-1/2/3 large subunit
MYVTAIISKIIKNTSGNLYLYPGGTIAPLLHECKKDNINLIVSKHEQGAGYMALAEAQLSHKPAFVSVTSGPGATNIITTIADAYYDSVPLVVLTGQVGTMDLQRSNKLRQRGFQEVPIAGMVKDITKKVFQSKSINELSDAIHQAYIIASSGRKGPVLIDMPMNIQLQNISDSDLKKLFNISRLKIQEPQYSINNIIIEKSVATINNSNKPVILVGGGAQEHWEKIRDFIKKSNIPVVSSLRGLGVVENTYLSGWIGHTGTPWANKILYEADTIIVFGSRLDVRQTGSETSVLDKKNIIHVDIDENELQECRIKNTLKINLSIVEYINLISSKLNIPNLDDWKKIIDKLKNENSLNDFGSQEGINPKEILELVDKLANNKKTYFTTGVGSHQHWTARYIEFDNKRKKLFTSAGHGTMGFGLPVAIGLANFDRKTQVICIDGDGSFQMNIQELALIQELDLNLKILILDNSRLGIVSQFQNITFKNDPTTGDFKNPDFVKIANAYGINAYCIDKLDEDIVLQWISDKNPSLLQVKIKHDTPISPMLLGGQKLNEMWYHEE